VLPFIADGTVVVHVPPSVVVAEQLLLQGTNITVAGGTETGDPTKPGIVMV
jgi:hypothetical protein